MYILQISDLHISTTSSFNIELTKNKIKQLGISLKEKFQPEQEVVCCILGDIIEKGDENAYALAEEIILDLLKELQNIVGPENVKLEIIPGNHDLCVNESNKSLAKFNTFASKFSKEPIE